MLDVLILPLPCQVEDINSISDQVFLDRKIKWRVCGETWRLIYFQQPGLAFAVDEYIKPEDLEAH